MGRVDLSTRQGDLVKELFVKWKAPFDGWVVINTTDGSVKNQEGMVSGDG